MALRLSNSASIKCSNWFASQKASPSQTPTAGLLVPAPVLTEAEVCKAGVWGLSTKLAQKSTSLIA